MTNWEKHRDELLNFKLEPSKDFCAQFIRPIILDPKGIECPYLSCSQCNMLTVMWLMDEYKEPKVDWSKVPVDTKIYVRSYEDDDWRPRYFAKYGDGVVWCWGDGKTSWSSKPGDSLTCWAYAKLAEDENESRG